MKLWCTHYVIVCVTVHHYVSILFTRLWSVRKARFFEVHWQTEGRLINKNIIFHCLRFIFYFRLVLYLCMRSWESWISRFCLTVTQRAHYNDEMGYCIVLYYLVRSSETFVQEPVEMDEMIIWWFQTMVFHSQHAYQFERQHSSRFVWTTKLLSHCLHYLKINTTKMFKKKEDTIIWTNFIYCMEGKG